MPDKNWYVHISGETFGPLSSEVVALMLQQNRLQFSDHFWSEGMAEWIRIGDVAEFAAYLPPYPEIGIPNLEAAAEAQAEIVEEFAEEEIVEEVVEAVEAVEEAGPEPEPEPEPEPAPAPAPRPALRAVPTPVPKPKAPAPVPVAAKAKPAPAPAPAPARTAAAAAAIATKAAPAPVAKKAVPATVAKTVPRTQVVLEKKPAGNVRRQWRVPIDATVNVEGHGFYKCLDISEGGCLLEATGDEISVGAEMKLKIESPSFAKALDMTALLVRQETYEGKRSYGVEFTKVNPAHRRTLAGYVKSKLSMNDE